MVKRFFIATLVCSLFPFFSCTASDGANNTPVAIHNLDKYMGTWYEVARFEHSFERGRTNTMTVYTKMMDGTIMVENSGVKNGKQKISTAVAKTTATPGLLRVSFLWPFYSDYRVLLLAEDYSYALVGGSSAKYLWILSRKPEISQSVRDKILKEATRRGYDIKKLNWVDQSQNLSRF